MNEVSPTMSALLRLLNEQRSKRNAAESEFRARCDDEATAVHEYRQAHAIAMLKSEQSSEGLRKAESEIATASLVLRRRLAIGLRRSAKEALTGCSDEAETLKAAFNAYNREIKAELELAGRVT